MSRTLILVKPDAFSRGLTGEILARFERKGLKIAALKLVTTLARDGRDALRRAQGAPVLRRARRLHHVGPAGRRVLEGDDVVKASRQLIGATNPLEAATGSIRGDFAIEVGQNLVHGSDSDESASARSGSGSPSCRPLTLVLASGSPQRRAILGDLGLDFDVRASDVAEEDEGAPRVVASENALRKALAVAAGGQDDVVIGCDTLVATDGMEIWGKPADEDAARATLRHLSGRTHEVVSGLAIVQRGDVRAATEITHVDVPRARRPRRSTGTCRPASGRAGRAATRSRAAGRCSSSASRATTSTWSGCRWRAVGVVPGVGGGVRRGRLRSLRGGDPAGLDDRCTVTTDGLSPPRAQVAGGSEVVGLYRWGLGSLPWR